MEELSIAQQLIDNFRLIEFKNNREICEIIGKEIESLKYYHYYLEEIQEMPEYVKNEYTEQVEMAKMRYYYSLDTCMDDLKDAIGEIFLRSADDADSYTRNHYIWFAQKHLEEFSKSHMERIFSFLDYLFETVYAEEICSSIIMRIKKMYVSDLAGTIFINNYDLPTLVYCAAREHKDELAAYTHLDPCSTPYIIGVIETIGPGIIEKHTDLPLMALSASITLLCRIGYVNQSIGVSYR